MTPFSDPDDKLILDSNYWNERYRTGQIIWDLGKVSPPIQAYVDQLTQKDIKILIPGCGNSYEADYLLAKGFTHITLLDISLMLVEELRAKYASKKDSIRVLAEDFFNHAGVYDLILEQTFFCALPPSLRKEYVKKTHQLLAEHGKLAGVLFDRTFEQEGPPFGGNKREYEQLFKPYFHFKTFEKAHNSIKPRANTELFINLIKKSLPD